MGNCFTCLKSPTKENDIDSASSSTKADDHIIQQQQHQQQPIISDGQNELRDKKEKETDELLTHNSIQLTTIVDSSSIIPQQIGGGMKKSLLLSNGMTQIQITSTTNSAKDQQHNLLMHQQHHSQVSDNTLNALFEEYKDTKEDAILSEGIERLCNDLGYKPDDFAILILAWRLDASQMCRFTKSEFIQGLQAIHAETITEIRLRLEQIVDKLNSDLDMFKQLYRFTFRFGLEPGHRIVSLEMAILLWRLVFTVHTPQILDRWLYFLEQHPNIRGVPKDTWNMFLNFSETFDITSYDDTEAWPSLFDDFVEYETDRANQNDVKLDKDLNNCVALQSKSNDNVIDTL